MSDTRRTLADLIDLGSDDDETPEKRAARGKLVPGDRIHFYATTTLEVFESPSMTGGSQTISRGQTVTITDEILRLNRDRFGNSFLDLVDDEGAQVSKWGQVLFARGAWPDSEPVIPRGDVTETWARQAAYEAAAGISDPDEAKAARAAIKKKFGAETSQRTLGVYEP